VRGAGGSGPPDLGESGRGECKTGHDGAGAGHRGEAAMEIAIKVPQHADGQHPPPIRTLRRQRGTVTVRATGRGTHEWGPGPGHPAALTVEPPSTITSSSTTSDKVGSTCARFLASFRGREDQACIDVPEASRGHGNQRLPFLAIVVRPSGQLNHAHTLPPMHVPMTRLD
jgi:hypothetical protein